MTNNNYSLKKNPEIQITAILCKKMYQNRTGLKRNTFLNNTDVFFQCRLTFDKANLVIEVLEIHFTEYSVFTYTKTTNFS